MKASKVQVWKPMRIGLVILVLMTIWTFWHLPRQPDTSPRFKLLLKWEAHKGPVNDLVFSPNGQFLVSAGWDGKVKIWDVKNSELIREIQHNKPVKFASLSPDGRLLATSSYDKTIRIWRFEDGILVRELKGHKDWVHDAIFSPCGKFLASASRDTTIKIWSLSNGQLIRTLTGHYKAVITLAFSPDGKFLASGSEDSSVRICQFPDGRLLKTLTGDMPGYAVNCVRFSPDGKLLAGGCVKVKVWDVLEGQLVKTLVGHKFGLSEIIFSSDGRFLVSSSSDGSLKFWELENNKVIWEWRDSKALFRDVAERLDVALNLPNLGFSLSRMVIVSYPVSVALSSDEQFLAFGLANGRVLVYYLRP